MNENFKEKSISMIINQDNHNNFKTTIQNPYLKNFNSLNNNRPTKIQNLPELKLIKMKSIAEYVPETNTINLKQYYKVKINKQKNTSMTRNNQNIIFPKIRTKNDDDNNNPLINNLIEENMNDDNKNNILHNSINNVKIINNNGCKRKLKNTNNFSMKLENGTKNINRLLLQPLPKSNNNNNTSLFNNQKISPSNLKYDYNYQNITLKKNLLAKEMKDLDKMTEKLNQINVSLMKISPFSSTNNNINNINNDINNILNDNTQIKKENEIPNDILTKYFPQFEASTTSSTNEFQESDFIKGYAYNTSCGIVRDYNEDTISVKKLNSKKNPKSYFYYFAIFDGHGGNACSIFLKENLYKHINEFSTDSLKNAIYNIETEYLNNSKKDTSGSCAVIALIQKNKCIIANVGDSRLVIFKNLKPFFITEDHKPNNLKEKERILKYGGQIYQNPFFMSAIFQLGRKINVPFRVLPGRLSVSRTIGDMQAKIEKYGGKRGVIIAVPDINFFEMNNKFEFLIIGCDGIFDVLSNDDIVDCYKLAVKNYGDREIGKFCGKFAEIIIKMAMSKESYDNVSCIVVVFNVNNINCHNNDNVL